MPFTLGSFLEILVLIGCAVASVVILFSRPRDDKKIRFAALWLFLLALVLRGFASIGITGALPDITAYQVVGHQLASGGDAFVPPALFRQNYPPLVIWWSALVAHVLPNASLYIFALLQKTAFWVGDALIVPSLYLLAQKNKLQTALLYAFNPLAIGICAIHGQFDSLVILPLIWSLVWLKRHPHLSGLLFGAALAVKTWPAFILAAVLSKLAPRKIVHWLILAAIAPTVVFVVYALIHPAHLADGVHQMISYVGVSNNIGLGGVLLPHTLAFAKYGNIFAVVLSTILMLYLNKNQTNIFLTVGIGLMLLLEISPTASAQYLIWPLAFLILSAEFKAVLAWSLILLPEFIYMEFIVFQNPAATLPPILAIPTAIFMLFPLYILLRNNIDKKMALSYLSSVSRRANRRQ